MTLLEYIQQRIEQFKQHNVIRFPIEKRINNIEEQRHGSKEKKSTGEGREGHKTR
jgi:hypothetical protein